MLLVQIIPAVHGVLVPSLYHQVLNIPVDPDEMCLPKILFLSPFWNVPFAQHIQACVIVTFVIIHSLLLTVIPLGKRVISYLPLYLYFPDGSVVKNPPANAGNAGSIPGLGRFPWSRKWQLIPVFLPGKSHARFQTSLAGYSPWGHTRVGDELATKQQQKR